MTSTPVMGNLREKKFADLLLKWHAANPRHLPFKSDKNPYSIWIAEIIFQQTRVEQGMPYYFNFLKRFPDIASLASAPEEAVLRSWQGLGYNTRARNLHAAARRINEKHGGEFPSTYGEIRALPGIGAYTAAAIASFAFGLCYPVIDANVIRLSSRLWGLTGAPQSTAQKQNIENIMQRAIEGRDPAEFNQAIMNFGAMICRPARPVCPVCPFKDACFAFRNDCVTELPVKKAKKERKRRVFHYLVMLSGEEVLLRQRETGDIWAKMFDFPLIEGDLSDSELAKGVEELFGNFDCSGNRVGESTTHYRQELTHQAIEAFFHSFEVKGIKGSLPEAYSLVNRKNLDNFAFPKLVNCYLRDNSILLD